MSDNLPRYKIESFWYDFFEENGYQVHENLYFYNSKNKIRGDIRVKISLHPLRFEKDRSSISAYIRFIKEGYWNDLEEYFNEDNIDDLLLVLKAITHQDLLPLCISIPWAAEIIADRLV